MPFMADLRHSAHRELPEFWVFRSIVPPDSGLSCLVQTPSHHFDIRCGVAMGRGNLRVPESRLDRQKIHSRLKKNHRE